MCKIVPVDEGDFRSRPGENIFETLRIGSASFVNWKSFRSGRSEGGDSGMFGNLFNNNYKFILSGVLPAY